MGIIINGLTDTVTAADGSLNIGGDVTIPGELSYDDVTSIDSVGVITARSDISIADKIVHTGDTNTAIRFPAADTFTVETAGSERLRIASNGNLGIGDESPTKLLTVGTTTPVILLDDQSSRTLEIRGPSTTHVASVLTTSTHDLLLGTNNAERLRIASNGVITQIGKSGAAASTAIDPLSSFVLNDVEARLQLCSTNTGSNASGIILSNESKHFVLHQKGVDQSNRFDIGYLDNASPTDINQQSTPRLTITTDGNLGIGGLTNPGALLSIPAGESNTPRLAIESAVDDNDFTITQYEDGNGTYTMLGQNVKLDSSGNNTILDSGHRTAGILLDARNHGAITFLTGGTNAVSEPVKITSDGKMGLGTNSPGSYDAEADNFVVAGSDHTGITIASTGSNQRTNLYFADGTSGNERYRGAITYDHNGDYMMMRTTGSERVRILGSGFVNIGSGYLTNSNSGLHVGRSSGGTAAGESVLAATLGDSSSMVSALLTVKNAGNRGSQGHSSGSPLAKFEFNNGTAFEIDKYGRRTLQYQPAFNAKLSTATGANFNGMLVFNNPDHNIGGHYDTSNGRFTAPLAGRYFFNFYTNVYRDGGSGSLWADWYVNNSAKGFRMYTQWDGGWELIGGSIVLSLSQNDYVQVYAGTSGNWDGGSYGSFNGYFLG